MRGFWVELYGNHLINGKVFKGSNAFSGQILFVQMFKVQNSLPADAVRQEMP